MFNTARTKIPLLFMIALLLLPYDAIRNTMPTTYRPISVYFFFIFAMFIILKNYKSLKINGDIKRVIIFYIFSVSFSGVLSVINTREFKYSITEFFSLTLGIITFIATTWGVFQIKKRANGDIEKTIFILFNCIAIAYLIPVFIWALDILATNSILPYSIKAIIMDIFGGFQSNRLTGTTLEASWLSKHAIFIIPIYYYLIKKEKKYKYIFPLIISLITFVLTFSLMGVAILVIGFVVYILLKGYSDNQLVKTIKNVFLGFIFISIVLYLFYYLMDNVLPATYYTNRIKNFTNFANLMETDASVFVRVGMPIISVLIFKDNLLGVGLGAYPYYFPQYIDKYFSYSLSFNEVRQYYSNLSAPGGSALLRVFAEFGLIGGVFFYNFLVKVYKNVSSIPNAPYTGIVIFWFALAIGYLSQEGYACIQFWFVLAILSGISDHKGFHKK